MEGLLIKKAYKKDKQVVIICFLALNTKYTDNNINLVDLCPLQIVKIEFRHH